MGFGFFGKKKGFVPIEEIKLKEEEQRVLGKFKKVFLELR